MAISESQKLKELQHYHDTSVGLWCIDRDPKEVDINWIRKHAFRLDSVDVIEQKRREAAKLADMHESDCAVHNEPAYPAGECDCSRSKNH